MQRSVPNGDCKEGQEWNKRIKEEKTAVMSRRQQNGMKHYLPHPFGAKIKIPSALKNSLANSCSTQEKKKTTSKAIYILPSIKRKRST